jgi:hypothetical protein
MLEYPEIWDGFLDKICDELLEEDEIELVDSALRVLINVLNHCREEHHSIPK